MKRLSRYSIKEANDCKVKKLRYIVFMIMSNEVLSIQFFLSNQTLTTYVCSSKALNLRNTPTF